MHIVDQVVLQKQISKSISTEILNFFCFVIKTTFCWNKGHQHKKANMFHVFKQTRFVVGPGEELFCTLAHSRGTFTAKRNIYFCNLAQTRTFQCVRIIVI